MSAALYAVAFVAAVVCGVAMVLGLSAIAIAGECSEDERQRGES